MIDGTRPATHALAQAFTGDGLVQGLDAPHSKYGAVIHAATDGETHHLHVTPVQITSTPTFTK